MEKEKDIKEQVIDHFKELNQYPRPSNYESGISGYLLSFAQKNGFSCDRDAANNVIIGKMGQHSNTKFPVILQAHMDMVPAVDEQHKGYNFQTNPVIPHTEDNLMTGRGSEKDAQSGEWVENPDIHTTLGADDGIGVATIMTILENHEIPHPPLVAVFTTGEEVGMTGAKKLTREFMEKASGMDVSEACLINVDEEQDGRFCYGCAGGVGITFTRNWNKKEDFSSDGFCGCRLTIDGLLGGHSGIDIGTGRANANCILGEILYQLSADVPFVLFGMEGGDAENAIAKAADATLGIPESSFALFEERLNHLFEDQKKKYASVETQMKYSIVRDKIVEDAKPMSSEDLSAFLAMIHEMPNDAQSFMTVTQPDGKKYEVVETSCNLGTIELSWEDASHHGMMIFQSSIRSFYDGKRDQLADELQSIAERNGFIANLHDEYSGWAQSDDSRLRVLFEDTYYEQNQTAAEGRYVHAGLECGVFEGILGNIDMIACGPTIHDVHTPKETLFLDTVPKVYNLIVGVLQKISR